MAMATASGGCGCARVGARERDRGGDEHGEGVRGPRGCVASPWRRLGAPGGARQAGREEVAGAGRPRASVLLAREEDDREEAVVGWAGQVGCMGEARY